MQRFLPLFPLNLVVFPNEKLNLHVFEPRYKQLVRECQENQSTFGVPTFLNKRLVNYGTEVKLLEVSKTYEDGRMDIKTQALGRFKILDFQKKVPNKLYAGGEILDYIVKGEQNNTVLVYDEFIDKVEELYELLKIQVTEDFRTIPLLSFHLGHRLGLSIEQEYEMLIKPTEAERQAFLIQHLSATIPVLKEIDRTKAIVQMNGHFKHFDPLTF